MRRCPFHASDQLVTGCEAWAATGWSNTLTDAVNEGRLALRAAPVLLLRQGIAGYRDVSWA